jgi:hypothetical protein
MLKRDNPYTPEAGHKPSMLAGRTIEIEEFAALVERLTAGDYERSLIHTGLRGVCKIVLLMELDASATGWATTDVQEIGSHPDFRVTFARMAARLLRDRPPTPDAGWGRTGARGRHGVQRRRARRRDLVEA